MKMEYRSITLRTGVGGYELFQEIFEQKATGYKRRYVGKKPMRILKSIHKLYKSASGRYYFKYKENVKANTSEEESKTTEEN